MREKNCQWCNKLFVPTGARVRVCPTCHPLLAYFGRRLSSIKCRCVGTRFPQNKCYVGIGVCSEWSDVLTFTKWALNNGFEEGLQIDRIDATKGYSPDNCRFVTPKENARYRRDATTDNINKTRKCYKCLITKSFDMFHKDAHDTSGIDRLCKACKKIKDKHKNDTART